MQSGFCKQKCRFLGTVWGSGGARKGEIAMQNALYVEISAVGIILLLIVLMAQREFPTSSAAQRRFNHLIYATMAMLVVDATCWLIDGQRFLFARELNFALETFYFALHGILPYLWALYVEGALSTDLRAANRRIAIATIPLVVFIVALFFNLEYGLSLPSMRRMSIIAESACISTRLNPMLTSSMAAFAR